MTHLPRHGARDRRRVPSGLAGDHPPLLLGDAAPDVPGRQGDPDGTHPASGEKPGAKHPGILVVVVAVVVVAAAVAAAGFVIGVAAVLLVLTAVAPVVVVFVAALA